MNVRRRGFKSSDGQQNPHYDLIAEARQRANMENTQFVLDAEVTARINAALGELYDLIVMADESYYQRQASFALTSAPPTGSSTATIDPTVVNTSTTNEINLPTDFYRMYGLDVTGAPAPVAVRKFNFAERNLVCRSWPTKTAREPARDLLRRYQRAGNTYTFYYTPVPTYLAAGSDALDAVMNPWWEYIAVAAAIDLLTKEESDHSALSAKKGEIAARVTAVAGGRDDEPDQIPDVTHRTGSRGDYDWWHRKLRPVLQSTTAADLNRAQDNVRDAFGQCVSRAEFFGFATQDPTGVPSGGAPRFLLNLATSKLWVNCGSSWHYMVLI